MDIGEISSSLNWIWLIVAILAIAFVGLYYLVRLWRKSSTDDLRKIGVGIRRLEDNYRRLRQTTEVHSIDDPEPYGSHAIMTHDQLDILEGRIQELRRRRISSQEGTNRLIYNRWKTFPTAPFAWYQLRKDISKTLVLLAESESALEEIRVRDTILKQVPWQVAQEARDLHLISKDVKSMYASLHARGIHGDAMDVALREQLETRDALAHIPEYFFEADEQGVLAKADKESTAAVHGLIRTTRPKLERLLLQGKDWDQAYSQTAEQVAYMQETIEAAEETLNDLPPGLQADLYIQRYEGIVTIAKSLGDTLGRLEVENMEMVSKESLRMVESVMEMDAELTRTTKQLEALETVLGELTFGLRALAVQVATLRTRTDHPVVWQNTVQELTTLKRGLNAIGPLDVKREPKEISLDLRRAARLNTHYRQLAEHCQKVEGAHMAWINLLERQEISRVDEWLENTRSLVDQTGNYAPANWPRANKIEHLPGEVEQLAVNVQRVLPPSPETPVNEFELPTRLEETRALYAALEDLSGRVEVIRRRFTQIQETETLAWEALQNARATHNQIAYIVKSNAFLGGIASRDAERVSADLNSLLAELEKPVKGVVEKSARRVSALLAKMEENANRWVDKLNGELRKVVAKLAASLAALETIAMVDEPVVVDARRLTSESSKYNLEERSVTKSRYKLEELASELKSRSDYWQSCNAAISALSEVQEVIMASYEEANQYRQEAGDLFAKTTTWLNQTRDWPPTSVSLEDERAELEELEDQWNELKGKKLRALALVQRLGSLSAKYQTLAEMIKRRAEQADQEHVVIEELEIELGELVQAWEDNRYAYRDLPEVDQELRSLLDEIDHEVALIQRQYKAKAKDYNQVQRAMKDLNRKVRYYQVALDENNALDASGQVRARR